MYGGSVALLLRKASIFPSAVNLSLPYLRVNPMPDLEATSTCAFVENKKIDFRQLETILSPAALSNHWANFGPVADALERQLSTMMNLPKEREVIICKSGTDALFVLANIKAIHRGHPLKWVVSAFGFFSTHIGSLSESRIIDCDGRGMLSLAELKALDESLWDGLIVTNVFGLFDDLSEYIDLCAELGKEIIIDNAVGFKYSARCKASAADEIISFHQTKPWGMGEGGCLVVKAEDAAIARSLINFGVNLDAKYRQYALNSKLPEISAALILQRLLDMPRWQTLYKAQTSRLVEITKELKLPLLAELSAETLVGNLPVLCPQPVDYEMLTAGNRPLCFGKYYKPLADDKQQAKELFGRMLNIPCHSQLADLSNDQITASILSVTGPLARRAHQVRKPRRCS